LIQHHHRLSHHYQQSLDLLKTHHLRHQRKLRMTQKWLRLFRCHHPLLLLLETLNNFHQQLQPRHHQPHHLILLTLQTRHCSLVTG
jgi:hypothetical protein